MTLQPDGRRLNLVTADGWEYEYDITLNGVAPGANGKLKIVRSASRHLGPDELAGYLADVKTLKAPVAAASASRGATLETLRFAR